LVKQGQFTGHPYYFMIFLLKMEFSWVKTCSFGEEIRQSLGWELVPVVRNRQRTLFFGESACGGWEDGRRTKT
jgi:hypothetical protein